MEMSFNPLKAYEGFSLARLPHGLIILRPEDNLTGHFGGCWFIGGQPDLDDLVNGIRAQNSGGPADNDYVHKKLDNLAKEIKAHPGFPKASMDID